MAGSPVSTFALPRPPRARRLSAWAHEAAILLLLLLALGLRVWQLDAVPPGLHYDEAFNGTQAREVLRGIQRPIFFIENYGEEPLHLYAEALLFALVGERAWAIRLTSAFMGVLLVAALYACARVFFPAARAAPLVAAFMGATLYWAINFSRIGIETNSLPFLLTLSAAALGKAYRSATRASMIGAGLLLGGTLYTYLASRLWPVAVFLWFIYLGLFHRRAIVARFPRWATLTIVALLVAAPLGLFFAKNPVAFAGRSGQVLTLETLGTNALQTAGMFLVTGDMDPRDNLPGRPALDPLLFILFVTGLIVALARWRSPLYALLVIWLIVMCLPSALTEFAPNLRRAIGAMPAAILLCALGGDWLMTALARRLGTEGGPLTVYKVAGTGLLGVALVISAFWSVSAYFGHWGTETGLYYSFDAGILNTARALAARPNDELIYISPDKGQHPTVEWALDGRPISSFDGRRALVLPPPGRAATYGIITYEDDRTLGELQQLRATRVLETIPDAEGKPYATLIRVEPRFGRGKPNAVHVGNLAALESVELSGAHARREESVRVTLTWLAERTADRDYTVFVHLVGPMNPATGSALWAQDDRQPGGGSYPTTQWQAGETIIETYTLKIPPDAPAARMTIEVGMYRLETNERLPLTQYGRPMSGDAFEVGAVTVE